MKKAFALIPCIVALAACSSYDPGALAEYDATCKGYGYSPGSSIYETCIGLQQSHSTMLWGGSGPTAIEKDRHHEQKRFGHLIASNG